MVREELGICFLSKVLALRAFTCLYSKRKTDLVIFNGSLVPSPLPYYSLAACTFQFKYFSSSYAWNYSPSCSQFPSCQQNMAKTLVTHIRLMQHISVKLSQCWEHFLAKQGHHQMSSLKFKKKTPPHKQTHKKITSPHSLSNSFLINLGKKYGIFISSTSH